MKKINQKFEKIINKLKKNNNNSLSYILDNLEFKKNNLSFLNKNFYTLKDNYATKKYPSQASSLFLKNFVPNYDSDVYKKLKKSGAILVAKTNLDEFGLGGEGIYSAFGIIKNPIDSKRKVGGSSSGAVASFIDEIDFAIGSDTGDSVRLPASFCGVVGFKPTYGAISRYGLFAYANSLDTVSYFAQNVSKIFEISKVLYGKSAKDLTSIDIKLDKKIVAKKPRKICILDFENHIEKYFENDFSMLIKKLKNEKIKIVKIQPDPQIMKAIKTVYQVISYAEASSNLANLSGIHFGNREEGKNWEEILANSRKKLGKMVVKRLFLGMFFLNKENQENIFQKSLKVRRIIASYFSKIYQSYDFLLVPSYTGIAPLIENKSKNLASSFYNWILSVNNLDGTPSITLKFSKHKNMPFGISMSSGLKKDQALLNFALWMEKFIKEFNHEK